MLKKVIVGILLVTVVGAGAAAAAFRAGAENESTVGMIQAVDVQGESTSSSQQMNAQEDMGEPWEAQGAILELDANGSGTLIAPALDSPDLRTRPDEELVQVIRDGVPGTLMAGWSKALSPEQIGFMVKLIDNWLDLIQVGLEFPETEMSSLPSSPEMIAAGDQLFNIACKSCHGLDTYGSPMAPALNNQIFLSQTPDAAIYQIIAAGIPGTRMPAWGSRLTDADIQSLVAYQRSLEITAPPIVPPILDGQ